MTNGGISSPARYYQFLTNISHYLRFVDENRFTRRAIKNLKGDERRKKLDKELVEQADAIIERMKVDRDKLVRAARRKGIAIALPNTAGIGPQLTNPEVVGTHLLALNDWLNLDGDEQNVADVSKYIGELRLAAHFLSKEMSRPPTWMVSLQTAYKSDQTEIARKVESFKVLSDYLRLDDYKELEIIKGFINDDMSQNDALFFIVVNDNLIDRSNTRSYNLTDIQHAKEMSDRYIGHLQRVHNYLTGELENPPWYSRLWSWFKEHLLPTFISLLIVLLIYGFAKYVLKLPVDLQQIKDLIK